MVIDDLARKVLDGHLLSDEEVKEITDYCKTIITTDYIDNKDYKDVYDILYMANVYYNNNYNGRLVIDDSIYDALVVMLSKRGLSYPIGAPQIELKDNIETTTRFNDQFVEEGKKQVVSFLHDKDKMNYFTQLTTNITPTRIDDYTIYNDNTIVEKKTRNTSHNYDMCGTLDKCKFVLDNEARANGMYDNSTVNIFERDFLAKHYTQGIINKDHIRLLVSLKYDGISVENTIKGSTIVNSCTRGDVYNNEASDITPILGGMEFQRAKEAELDQDEFGIKFEYVITDTNMRRLLKDAGFEYVNRRNAVIGIFGRLDARNYRDYLTPVPLESSLDTDRLTEIEFLNRYFTKGLDLRYTVIEGNYLEVLKQVKDFVDEAEKLRTFMPFAYDGVVVEYVDENIRKALGKLNSVPRYAIAIKFNPLKRQSIFTHYTYSVGQTGVIVPMAHFEPVEFFGAVHDKTTIHSLARFNKLKLKRGDRVNLSLNNDVIVYLTKADYESEFSAMERENEIEQFPTHCPCCNTLLVFSDSGDSAYCPNFYCKERAYHRVANMLKKLNIKDFGVETIRALDVNTIEKLFSLDKRIVKDTIGDVNGEKLFIRLNTLKTTNYPDYRLIGSIGFTGIAESTWKLILSYIPIDDILNEKFDLMNLCTIKGIGRKTIETIINERKLFEVDLGVLFSQCVYTKSPILSGKELPNVVFTGVRDERLEKLFTEKGFEVKDSSVTAKTKVLVIPYYGFISTKVEKAFKLASKRVSQLEMQPIDIGYQNLQMVAEMDVEPFVMDVNSAYEYIKNYIYPN